MLISELAEQTSLPVHTIRFYERKGLLDERFFHRGDNGYRHYTSASVERILMIKHGQAAGYTLAEIRELLHIWDAGELTDKAQIVYIQQKVDEIAAKITELQLIQTYLTEKLSRLNAVEAVDQVMHEDARTPSAT